ncbi:MAG TPA: hypothetical protein VH054_00405 [Polyangiaceae bacterium]|jgi:hypothetical protein|nr:hypothetical protein [Polyangiaceae bacterium]
MKLLAAATFAFTTCVLATTATTARADDDMPDMSAPRIEHRSKGAHAAGVALTVTGVTFFGLGGVASAGALFTLAGGFGRDTGGGFGTLIGGIFFGMVAGGCTVLGLSTFIPGIVLMNNNAAPKSPELEAHKLTPAPSFTTFPIVSATF